MAFCEFEGLDTYQLELNRHQAEVDDLDSGPDHKVGLQRRDIHVPQLVVDGSSATTLCNGHHGKEACNTCENVMVSKCLDTPSIYVPKIMRSTLG